MSYVEQNRWFITASKVKLYTTCKEAYKKVYIDEVDTSIIKDSPALEKWTMVDQYILSPEVFNQNYALPVWRWLKKELQDECLRMSIPVEKSDTIDDLKAKLYWNKTVCTPWELEMLEGIKRELQRQPLYDMEWEYETQKQLIVEYKWFKLKWTLDRVSVEKWLIRDLKTTKDLEYAPYHDCTWFEDKLIQNDQYQYWFQLARYRVLCFVHYQKKMDWVIDAVKTTWNFAYESYRYSSTTLEKIASQYVFPVLDKMLEDHKNNTFIDENLNRTQLINERYYPILDSAIQQEYREIVPTFY